MSSSVASRKESRSVLPLVWNSGPECHSISASRPSGSAALPSGLANAPMVWPFMRIARRAACSSANTTLQLESLIHSQNTGPYSPKYPMQSAVVMWSTPYKCTASLRHTASSSGSTRSSRMSALGGGAASASIAASSPTGASSPADAGAALFGPASRAWRSASAFSRSAFCSGVSSSMAPNLAARAARLASSSGSNKSIPVMNCPPLAAFFSACSRRTASTSFRESRPFAPASVLALGALYSVLKRSARARAFSRSASRTLALRPEASCSASTSAPQSPEGPPPKGCRGAGAGSSPICASPSPIPTIRWSARPSESVVERVPLAVILDHPFPE